jgi:tetratricopeptide (TPR) repeat protein
MFSTFHLGHYQPLSWVTFGLDYLLWGMDPFGYHLTNLLLHTANAVIFYFAARHLLSFIFFPSMAGKGLQLRIASVIAALFFAIHPLRVESVVWLTERRDVLSGLLVLCSLLFYLRAASAPDAVSRWRRLGIAVGFYGLSLFSKATGITLPAILLVLDIYPLRRLGHGNRRWFGMEVRHVWWEKVPFVILAIPFSVLALMAQREAGALMLLEQYGVAARTAQALFGIAFYLWKSVFPVRLSPLYQLSNTFHPSDSPFVLSGLVVLALSVVMFAYRRRWPGGLASWVCYVIVVSPMLGIAQSGVQMVADRYTYLSCLCWAIMVGACIYLGWNRWGAGRTSQNAFVAAAGLVASFLLVLGGLTWRQSGVWHDSERLWSYAAAITPESSLVHCNLGLALEKRGDFEGAIQNYRTALKTNPASALAYHNRGHAYNSLGDYKKAIEDFNRAIEIKPKYTEAYINRANAYNSLGNYRQAIEDYDRAIEINPKHAEAYYNRGIAYNGLGDYRHAIEDYDRAIQINPRHAEAYYNRGHACNSLGDYKQAIKDSGRAIAINPEYMEAYINRGVAYNGLGNYKQAIEDYDRAIEINPRHAEAYYNRGHAYNSLGNYKQAIEDYDRAIEINPKYTEAYINRANAYNSLGDHRHAIEDCDRAIEINPRRAVAYYNRGIAYGRLGNDSKAIEDLTTAARLGYQDARDFLRSLGITW